MNKFHNKVKDRNLKMTKREKYFGKHFILKTQRIKKILFLIYF